MKLIGMYLSEGCLQIIKGKNTSYVVSITQSENNDERKNVNYINEFLDNLNIKHGMFKNKKNTIDFKIYGRLMFNFFDKYCGRGSHDKKIPDFIFKYDNKYLKILYNSLMRGDGNKNGFRYSTVSKNLAKDFTYLCLRIGKVAKYKLSPGKIWSYRILIRENPVCSISKRDRKIVNNYDNFVYCVECEKNHIIMAGRNNKLRWIGQSVFGQLGYQFSRFYNQDCAKAITLIGQFLNKTIIEELKRKQIGEIVMGDTDSFAIKLKPGYTDKDVLNIANNTFEKCKLEHNIDKIYSELELEAVIEKMILFGVKKKYAQLIKNKQKVQGLEMIRKDCCKALKEFQTLCIKQMFETENPGIKIINNVKNDISNKIRLAIKEKDYMYFAQPTVIKKKIDDYKSNTMEKKALENSGLKISINEMFYLIFCNDDKVLAFKNVEELEKFNFAIDYERTCERVFNNIRIFEDLFVKQCKLFDY